MVLKSTGTNLPSERISALMNSWKTARQSRATAFLNADVDISTIGIGKVMSAGVPLLAAGTKGKRFLAENARIMIHNASAGAAGIIPTMEEEINEFKNIQDMYIRLLSENTNMSEKKIRAMLKKKANIYLSAKQAIELGIADHIL
ncbi:MAG: hypothetical protein EBW49_09845 [Betaproteobacteria bacterium]|nr:hypothetical protein [Betaproteobacteria bacterium]